MKVLRKKVNEPWQLVDIENTQYALESELEGKYERISVFSDACFIVRENHILSDLLFNTKICGQYFFGTIFLVGVSDEKFCDIPDSAIELIERIRI